MHIGPGIWKVVGFFDADGSAFDSEIWADANVLNGNYQRPSGVFQSVTAGCGRRPTSRPSRRALERDTRACSCRRCESGSTTRPVAHRHDAHHGARRPGGPGHGTRRVLAALNTMYSAVAERWREIAVLRALGFTGRTVVLSFLSRVDVDRADRRRARLPAALPVNGITTGTMNWQTFSHLAFAFRITRDLLALGLAFALLMGVWAGCRRRSALPVRTCRGRCVRCDGRCTRRPDLSSIRAAATAGFPTCPRATARRRPAAGVLGIGADRIGLRTRPRSPRPCSHAQPTRSAWQP